MVYFVYISPFFSCRVTFDLLLNQENLLLRGISCLFTIYRILAIGSSYNYGTYTVATILRTVVCMDYVGLASLDPLLCKTLLQAIWPYMEEDVTM